MFTRPRPPLLLRRLIFQVSLGRLNFDNLIQSVDMVLIWLMLSGDVNRGVWRTIFVTALIASTGSTKRLADFDNFGDLFYQTGRV